MPASAWVTIEKLVYFVLFPCLLFYSVVNSPIDPASVGWFALAAPVIIGSAFVMGWLAWPFGSVGRVDFASGLQTAYRFNSYIGLALASRLAGQEAVANLAVLLAVGVPLCNVLAVGSMSKAGRLGAIAEILKNPLIIGTGLGIVVKLLGLPVPEAGMRTLERLGQAAVSLGLLAVGSGLVFSGLRGYWPQSLWWLAIKLLISPMIGALYASWVGLDALQTAVVVVFASIPSASSAYILAARMGGNAALVACLISMSTVAAAATLPAVFLTLGWMGLLP